MSLIQILIDHPATRGTVDSWRAIGDTLIQTEIAQAGLNHDGLTGEEQIRRNKIRNDFSVVVLEQGSRVAYVFQRYLKLDYQVALEKMQAHLSEVSNAPPIEATSLLDRALEYGQRYRSFYVDKWTNDPTAIQQLKEAPTTQFDEAIERAGFNMQTYRDTYVWETDIVRSRACQAFKDYSGQDAELRIYERQIEHWSKDPLGAQRVEIFKKKRDQIRAELKASNLEQMGKRVSDLSLILGALTGLYLGMLTGALIEFPEVQWTEMVPFVSNRSMSIDTLGCVCIEPASTAYWMIGGGLTGSTALGGSAKRVSSSLWNRYTAKPEESTR
jgi:hypothetical protein